jgi:translation initiation factor 1
MRGDDFFRSKPVTALSGAVYSTQTGDMRKSAPAAAAALPDGKNIRIAIEKKGRGGKTVSVIHGLPLAADALQTLCTALKKRCGSGGSVVDQSIEIQGEHRGALLEALRAAGFSAKLAGG